MKVKTQKQGAIVSSPNGYRALAFPFGGVEAKAGALKPSKRDAVALVRKATLGLGLGAYGEVLGGEKFDSVVYRCRVVYDTKGKLTIQSEDV